MQETQGSQKEGLVFEVIYYSRGGNTARVADSIASELGATASDVKTGREPSQDSFLFLGSGCYYGKPGKEMIDFIQSHDFKGRKVALFGTSGNGRGQETTAMEEMLKGKGCNVVGKFCCTGSSTSGHPDAAELEGARAFARKMKA